jgi:tetratricopeptide (TPR) repeat protein
LAVAAFVCGLCSVLAVPALIGLVLGILALRQIGRSGGQLRGRGLAMAGTLMSGVAVTGMLVLGADLARRGIAERHKGKGESLVETGRFDAGLTEYERALRILPGWQEPLNRARWSVQLALEARMRNEITDAQLDSVVAKATAIDPANAAYQSVAKGVRGWRQLGEGHLSGAIQELRTAAEDSPPSVRWRVGAIIERDEPLGGLWRALLGEALRQSGDRVAALAAWDQAVSQLQSPWREYLLCRKAAVLRLSGRPAEGLAALEQCQEPDPSRVPAFVGVNAGEPGSDWDRRSSPPLRIERDYPCPPKLMQRSLRFIWAEWLPYQRVERWGRPWQPGAIRTGTSRHPQQRGHLYMLPLVDMAAHAVPDEYVKCADAMGGQLEEEQLTRATGARFEAAEWADYEARAAAANPQAKRVWWTPLTQGFPHDLVLASLLRPLE